MDIADSLRRAALAAVVAAALAACATSSDTALGDSGSAVLHGRVDAIRAAAANGDEAALGRAVEDFRGAVAELFERGELDPAEARTLLAGADGLRVDGPRPADDAAAKPAAPTPAPKPTPKPNVQAVAKRPVDPQPETRVVAWRPADPHKQKAGKHRGHGGGRHGHH